MASVSRKHTVGTESPRLSVPRRFQLENVIKIQIIIYWNSFVTADKKEVNTKETKEFQSDLIILHILLLHHSWAKRSGRVGSTHWGRREGRKVEPYGPDHIIYFLFLFFVGIMGFGFIFYLNPLSYKTHYYYLLFFSYPSVVVTVAPSEQPQGKRSHHNRSSTSHGGAEGRSLEWTRRAGNMRTLSFISLSFIICSVRFFFPLAGLVSLMNLTL